RLRRLPPLLHLPSFPTRRSSDLLLVLLRHLVPFVLERAVQGVLDHVEEFLLPGVEVGLPHLVDVLGSIVVVEDARVRERLADREDLHFLHRVLGQVRDRGQVGASTPRPFGLLLDRTPRHHHLSFPWHDSSTSELDLLRRVSDADLDLGVLEPEVADPCAAGVVVPVASPVPERRTRAKEMSQELLATSTEKLGWTRTSWPSVWYRITAPFSYTIRCGV